MSPAQIPTLPQHDPAADDRARALAAARETWRPTFAKYAGVVMAETVPKDESPPADWSTLLDGALKQVVANDLRADRAAGALGAGLSDRARQARDGALELLHGDLRAAVNDLSSLLLGGTISGRATGLPAFADFFRTIDVPALAEGFPDDARLSRKPVCGANPESLERVRDLDPDARLDDAMLQQVLPGDTLAAALDQGRLFVCDYRMLGDLPPNEHGGGRRVVAPARVFSATPAGGGPLHMFAIRLQDDAQAPVFTPADGPAWRVAQIHAAVADTIAGALWFHHARTHLVAEPFVLAMHRQLAPAHPLRRLLEPHFMGTAYINEIGWKTVFAPHGLLDWFTGTPQHAVRALSRRSLETFRFDESVLPARLAARGVDDARTLPDFPWRDDALLVWGALEGWVQAYVGLYYASDEDVVEDTELQAWIAEVTAPEGGGLQGLGEGGRLRTRDYLVQTLTQLVFTVSALHSSMNFPVLEEMTFVPNSPFGAWADPPRDKGSVGEADVLAVLPDLDAAQRQFDTALLLGSARYGRLGALPEGWFADPRAAAAHEAFVAALAAVEGEITARNEAREPYIHLLPSRISPSINI